MIRQKKTNLFALLAFSSVTFSQNLESIGSRAFSICSQLTEINLPDNVTSIGDYAFSSCSNVDTIKLPKNIDSIGTNAFSNINNWFNFCRNKR